MSKKREAVKAALDKALENSSDTVVMNGLGEAIGYGGFNASGLPGANGFPGTEQISGVNTIFKNLRWFLVSNFRQVLNEIYVEIGLVSTIVDVPVEDALRGGVMIKSKQLDEDEIKELQKSLKREGDLTAVAQGAKWQRLFGGAGIIVMTDQDPETPFDLEAIGPDDYLQFRAVDMWELSWSSQNTEGYDPTIQSDEFEYYDYYGEKLHKSRVLKLPGRVAPSFIRPRLRGWGVSVVEQLVRSINQYLKATDLSFEVLDEFKLDVYKIKNLVNTLLSPNGQQKINQRVQMSNYQKNYQNAIVMDSEDDFDHKQLSFSGLAEAMEGIRMQVAADMRIPRSKLFGEAGSGLNSGSNEGDLEVYNSMVESEVRNKIEFDLLRVCEIRCQKLFGRIPDDLEIEFKPLRVLSAEQEERVKDSKFNRLLAAKTSGEITRYEFREACNKGNLLDISLDNAGDELNPDDPQIDDVVTAPVAEVETDDGDDDKDDGDKKPKKNAAWDESSHPRAGDGKFGAGGKGGDDESQSSAIDRKIAALEEKVEKAEDQGVDTTALKKQIKKLKDEASKKKKENDLPPFHPVEKFLRLLNSIEYDKAAYEVDGGDDWIAPGRREFFEDPSGVDQALWAKAKEASEKAFGEERWQFVVWFYKKQGGKFHE